MIRKSLLLASLTLAASSLYAAQLTPQEALARAKSSSAVKKVASNTIQPQLVYTEPGADGEASVYVFNKAENQGILFLSADDVAVPVLGYTDSGSFDPENIPSELKYWLGQYSGEIAFARKKGVKANAAMVYPTDWQYVAPLVKSQWDQLAPYNRMTPTYGTNSHYPTGCVATAMAQIMNYWKYPEIGTGSVSYTWMKTPTSYETLTMTFNRESFDWNNMLDVYTAGKYNDTQANAVAYLMKACGYASQMQYEQYSSGTQSHLVGPALVKYFNYDSGVSLSTRSQFSNMEWNQLVYDQVSKVGPVLYSGESPEGGHAFVVDGYDGNGYFHLNWGWSGDCNGYYLLSALNPTETGTGGAEGEYNYNQFMLYNIQKPTGKDNPPMQPMLTMMGNLNATINGSDLRFFLSNWDPCGYANHSMVTFTPRFGIEITNADGSGTPVYNMSTTNFPEIAPGLYLNNDKTFNMSIPPTLADGKYKVRLVWRPISSNTWSYFEVTSGYHDYVYLTKNGTNYTVETLPVEYFEMTNAEIISPLYFNYPAQLRFTFKNNTQSELTQLVQPVLLYGGKPNFNGETQLISLSPGEETTVVSNLTFEKTQTGQAPSTVNPIDMKLAVYDYNSGYNYGTFGTYTMKRATSGGKFTLQDLSITNASEFGAVDNVENVYSVDFSNVNLGVTLYVGGTSAFVASPLTATVYVYDPTTGKEGEMVYEKEFEDMVYLSSGNTTTATTALDLSSLDKSNLYSIKVSYVSANTRPVLGSVLLAATSGVNFISDDGQLSVDVDRNMISANSPLGISALSIFDINGKMVANPAVAGEFASFNTSSLSKGIYIVVVKDNGGNTRTLKVIL